MKRFVPKKSLTIMWPSQNCCIYTMYHVIGIPQLQKNGEKATITATSNTTYIPINYIH